MTLLAALAIGLLAQIVPAHADNEDLDFTLANRTGYVIKEIYMAPE